VVGRPLDETEQLELARKGDLSAYEIIVHAHQGIAFRTAYLVTGSAADAEEAVQDAFVKAFRALGRFRRGAPFRPWLLQIVVNEARNRRRSAVRRTQLQLRAQAEGSGGAAPSPEAVVLEGERREELLLALNGLSDDDRTVLGLRYFLDLSEQETADVLGVARGTVKSRTSRALERMRAAMGATP
jgi:RNA polymerase sigma-70 factor (ECF subfamily)